MRIERIELFELRLPLKRAYETSGSRETHQTRVIARVESEGAVGWGESVAPELPWYSGETPKTVWYLLDEIVIPALMAAELHQPEDTERIVAWIREHRMAKATLEMAIWDLFAKRDVRSLSKLLGGTRARILCDDARKAIELGATRIINIKAGRVGGLTSARRVHDVCREARVPVWCGGMLEMGIGRAHNVHLASLPNFSLPGDVSASERYFATEIIGEPFTVRADGTMLVPTGPGIGVTVLEKVIRKIAVRTKEHRATRKAPPKTKPRASAAKPAARP